MGSFVKWGRGRGTDKEAPIVVMAKRQGKVGGTGRHGLEVHVDYPELLLAIGAASLVDAVSSALTIHHAGAIAGGFRPSGGVQSPLNPRGRQGKRAAAGLRPNVRGNTGNPDSLPPNLTRSEVSVRQTKSVQAASVAVTAEATISPATDRQAGYLAEEDARGNEFFAVTGEAGRVIDDAVIDYMTGVFSGTRYYSKEKARARDL